MLKWLTEELKKVRWWLVIPTGTVLGIALGIILVLLD